MPSVLPLHRSWLLVALCAVFTIACGSEGPVPPEVQNAQGTLGTADAGPPVQYAYDEAGRLIAVYAPNGESARYIYDEGGNILSVQRFGAADLAIHGFTPSRGAAGQQVIVTGSGFSPTPASNTVAVGGAPATVLAATTSRLIIEIPPIATTGKISIGVGTATTISNNDLVIGTAPSAPTITGFSPKSGPSLTQVVVTGSGFGANTTDNRVSIGGMPAMVKTATATQLSLSVSPRSRSGRIKVVTPTGTATSAEPFMAVNQIWNTDDVSGTITIDGAATQIQTAGGSTSDAFLSFDGTTGERLGLGISPFSTTPAGGMVVFTIYDPQGSVLTTCTRTVADQCDVPRLPMDGTYTLFVDPQGAPSASMSLLLTHSVTATIQIDGPTINFTNTRPGQDGEYQFTISQPTNLTLVLSGNTFEPGSWFWLQNAAGQVVNGSPTSISSGQSASWSFRPLPAGSYTIGVSPWYVATGQATFALLSEDTGTLDIDGPPTTVNLSASRNGRYTFQGTAGDRTGLGVLPFSMTPPGSGVTFTVYNPDGSQLTTCHRYEADSCDIPPLPATGMYSLFVDPPDGRSASMSLYLTRSKSGTIQVGGAVVTFSNTRPGQDGGYQFTISQPTNVTLLLSNNTFNQGSWFWLQNAAGQVVSGSPLSVGAGETSNWSFRPLPAGTYTIGVSPWYTATGQLTFSLLGEQTGTLSIDGPPTNVSLSASQNGHYDFQGVAGDWLGLGISPLTTSPSGGWVSFVIYKPDGSALVSCGRSAADQCDIPTLPATGTYSLFVDPSGPSSASMSLYLTRSASGPIQLGGPSVTFTSTRPGQDALYSLTLSAPTNITMMASGNTFPKDMNLVLISPSGQAVGGSWSTISAGQSESWTFNQVPAGTYLVWVGPWWDATGQVTVSVIAEDTGTLSIDGPPTSVSLSSSRNGRYSFQGIAGDWLGLGISPLTTSPSGSWVSFVIYKPDGSALVSCGRSTADQCDIPTLPATGTYSLFVDPSGPSSASMSLYLTRSASGPIQAGGPSVTFTSTRPGQDALYSLTLSTPTNITMMASGNTFPKDMNLVLISPSGQAVGGSWSTISAGQAASWTFNQVPAGTYLVWVGPWGNATGQVSVSILTEDADTHLSIDGPPATVYLSASRDGRYDFQGTTGDRLGLGIAPLATSPAGYPVSFAIQKPDGSTLMSCSLSAADQCDIPMLPVSGTYSLLVDPPNSNSASMGIYLSRTLGGSIPLGGSPVVFASSRPGQDGLYELVLAAPTTVTLSATGNTFPKSLWLVLLNPAGQDVDSSRKIVNAGQSISWTFTQLPAGTYKVLFSAWFDATGQISVQALTP